MYRVEPVSKGWSERIKWSKGDIVIKNILGDARWNSLRHSYRLRGGLWLSIWKPPTFCFCRNELTGIQLLLLFHGLQNKTKQQTKKQKNTAKDQTSSSQDLFQLFTSASRQRQFIALRAVEQETHRNEGKGRRERTNWLKDAYSAWSDWRKQRKCEELQL